MLSQVLYYFPAHTYPLTLVSDPDGLLLDEQLLHELGQRGFRLINEPDPIMLRYRLQQAKPWSAAAPLIVVTTEPVNTLPYDLWQQGHAVALDLHRLLPDLNYPLIRQLSSAQRARLSMALQSGDRPTHQLSQRETLQFLLQHVFGIQPAAPLTAAMLIARLDDYHATNNPMPPPVATYLGQALGTVAQVRDWPLAELLTDAARYREFVQQAWQGYVRPEIKELSAPYTSLPFLADEKLQNLVPRLVRSGTLAPVSLPTTAAFPAWAQPGLAADPVAARQQQLAAALSSLEDLLAAATLRWEQWQTIARLWAQLTVWRAELAELPPQYTAVQQLLDGRFVDWLRLSYAALGGRALPQPHHLYHVPGWLAELRRAAPTRIALLVVDGMALADWLLVREHWQARRPTWRLREHLVLAQIPSITAISRQALISGRKPQQFASSLLDNRQEARHWSLFWQNHDLSPSAIGYAHLSPAAAELIESPRIMALCLTSTVIDDLVHSTTLGNAGFYATLRVWLHQPAAHQPGAAALEATIAQLLAQGYTIALTSDHGHVEALGLGQPQEGVLALSRGKRARLYNDPAVVEAVQRGFPATVVWHNDDLLPATVQVVIPQGRGAFAAGGTTVVTHGGITIDELIVPLIVITQG